MLYFSNTVGLEGRGEGEIFSGLPQREIGWRREGVREGGQGILEEEVAAAFSLSLLRRRPSSSSCSSSFNAGKESTVFSSLSAEAQSRVSSDFTYF